MAYTLEIDGDERTLSEWGIDEASVGIAFRNMAPDVMTFEVPGPVDGDAIVGFEEGVVFRRGRTWNALTEAWEGGAVEFSGIRGGVKSVGQADHEGLAYEILGPWHDIEETPFLQSVKVYTGDPDALGTVQVSDVQLFQEVTGPGTTAALTNGQQVQRALEHMLDDYAARGISDPFQIGTIEPDVNLPTYSAKDFRCGEVIRHCLRPSPNAAVWFDYTTVPPTVHVTLQANMDTVTVALGDGAKHQVVELLPRPDLQAAGVVLHFWRTNVDNGQTWREHIKQKAPIGGPEGGRRVLVQTIDLHGYQRTDEVAVIKCAAIANTRPWWAQFEEDLASTKFRAFTLLGAMSAVDDETQTAVDLDDYPNVLLDGQLAAWMEVGGNAVDAKRVTITAECSLDQYDVDASAGGDPETKTNGNLLTRWVRRKLVARVTVTNAVSGTYSELDTLVEGEAVPEDLAGSIYDALNVLQYEGRVVLSETEITTLVRPGQVLNLTGGRTEWTTMAAIVQSVQRDYGRGRTTVQIGPAKHLGAGELTQLFLINRNRQVLVNPLTQATAKAGQGRSISLGDKLPRRDSQSALPERCVSVMAKEITGGNKVLLSSDADLAEWWLGTVEWDYQIREAHRITAIYNQAGKLTA